MLAPRKCEYCFGRGIDYSDFYEGGQNECPYCFGLGVQGAVAPDGWWDKWMAAMDVGPCREMEQQVNNANNLNKKKMKNYSVILQSGQSITVEADYFCISDGVILFTKGDDLVASTPISSSVY